MKRKLINLPQEVWDRYKKEAEENGLTTNSYIRMILMKRLEEN